ncbi:hypothetical protein QTG54_011048 [Skeletonema marinoi]|uniref:Uncharacterized protein n=1 Tax=Skeletonema marinoi TaxID=267567 RepID=A0AAD8Y392_9STRA|nr:hypothetical protein QTG54_011048 [Skeletonema marinoi]
MMLLGTYSKEDNNCCSIMRPPILLFALLLQSAHSLQSSPPLAFVASRASKNCGSGVLRHRQQRTKQYLSDDDEEIIPINNDRSILAGESTFQKYGRPSDINSDSFGPLLPIAEAVDEVTGGWALTYADLHPATPRTTIGQAFLATNIFYAAGGLALGVQGDWFYGALTELAGIVSFIYHYSQLEFGKNRSEVRLALLVDYFTAGAALICGGVYMVQMGIDTIPIDALLTAVGASVCLALCWVWEFGYPYIFWHSLWHILSALTGYLIGQDHLLSTGG